MRRALAAVAALVAIGGVAALVVVAARDPEPRLTPPGGDPVLMEATVSPSRYMFGDRLLAEIELTIDATRVEPDSVVPAAFFRPFRRLGPIETERLELGETTLLRFLYHIQCVDRACVPAGAERVLELPLGLVRYSPREGDVVTLPLSWPEIEVASQLSSGSRRDLLLRPASLAAQAEADELPPLELRGGPSLLGWLLVGAAAGIVLTLGAWLAWRLWPRRAAGARVEEPERPPLEAAVARVESALAGGGEDERRAALDVLARALARAGDEGMARDASRLAWSEPEPPADRAATLVEAARRRTGAAA